VSAYLGASSGIQLNKSKLWKYKRPRWFIGWSGLDNYWPIYSCLNDR